VDVPEPAGDDLLSVTDVAARLRVTEETVREWLRTDRLQGYNFGGRTGWRIPAREVDALLLRNKPKRHVRSRPESR
jgi:excisionase family DNA binding protein